ncbi:MAG TPA: hypothetical protein VMV50_03720 [Candidatus Paceibacterota bacterium]|nr:hypothetical protein [Candidatus Paceibacterota bacterium]
MSTRKIGVIASLFVLAGVIAASWGLRWVSRNLISGFGTASADRVTFVSGVAGIIVLAFMVLDLVPIAAYWVAMLLGLAYGAQALLQFGFGMLATIDASRECMLGFGVMFTAAVAAFISNLSP